MNIGAKGSSSAELAPCILEKRVKQFEHMVWIRVMLIFRWLFLFFLVRRCQFYRWVVVVDSWKKYLILTVDLWASSAQHLVKLTVNPTLDSSALFHIHPASHDFRWYTLVYFFRGVYILDFYYFFPWVSQDHI